MNKNVIPRLPYFITVSILCLFIGGIIGCYFKDTKTIEKKAQLRNLKIT